ncbi:hypothetical protein Patl1_35234 [Pistacia atlantica]|uniref:Uncharacterized protein n=1 Tax=Pistacia atlantica TaxID=434234 RepID=A0ACC0ZW63_9ROSI|nr:hypothetical protein Patl1_35234 [Pistacia atlantica]
MRCVCDQNGNHVIQKCIECVPTGKNWIYYFCFSRSSCHTFYTSYWLLCYSESFGALFR